VNSLATRLMMLAVVLLTTAPGWAEQPQANPEDVKALHELHRAYVAAFNKGDAQAVAAFYTPDGDRLRPTGQMTKGRAELEKDYASFFAKLKGAKLNFPFGSLRFLTPGAAIADSSPQLTPAPEGGPNKVHATVVYVKREGKWMIAALRVAAPYRSSGQ
jgi:uncharacterized protein (TIGR02246 family)